MVSPPINTIRVDSFSALWRVIPPGVVAGRETITIDIHRAQDYVDCALLAGSIQWQHSAGFKAYIGVDRVGKCLHGRTASPGFADHHADAFTFGFEEREVYFFVMGKERRAADRTGCEFDEWGTTERFFTKLPLAQRLYEITKANIAEQQIQFDCWLERAAGRPNLRTFIPVGRYISMSGIEAEREKGKMARRRSGLLQLLWSQPRLHLLLDPETSGYVLHS
jgi:hypothetical protein